MTDVTTWDDLLDDFEDLIEQVGHAVELDDFHGRAFPHLVKTVPHGEPSDDHRIRFRALLAEAEVLGRDVQGCQAAVRTELDQLQRESRASRAYLGSTP